MNSARNTAYVGSLSISFVFVSLIATLFYLNMSSADISLDPPTENANTANMSTPASNNNKVNGDSSSVPKSAAESNAPSGTVELSGAALKAKKKAEKAAERAQRVAARQVGPAAPISSGKQDSAPGVKGPAKVGKPAGNSVHRRSGSTHLEGRPLVVRGGKQVVQEPKAPPKEDKTVELFRHLYKTRASTIAGASKDVHPAVLALGQQMSSYVICGSNARLVATMQVFKRVCIESLFS